MARAQESRPGTLYVVATPLGNLDDLSPRARSVLQNASLVAAEDTRRTGRLLSSIGVENSLISYHEHNEAGRSAELVDKLEAGRDIALVSDAGTPLVSDPGAQLVAAARRRGITVECVPGPCAVTAALSISGLPTDRFVFEGFLPRKRTQRDRRLDVLAAEPRTLVLYEAVHRMADTLAALVEHFGAGRPAALARELTKLHEQTRLATLGELHADFGREIPALGEFVLVVGGAPAPEAPGDDEVRRVFALLSAELDPRRAVALTAEITSTARNDVYRLTRGAARE